MGVGGGMRKSRYFMNLCYARIVIWLDTVLHNLVSCNTKTFAQHFQTKTKQLSNYVNHTDEGTMFVRK